MADIAKAAALLAKSWQSGALLDCLPEGLRPATMAEGYEIQDALASLLGFDVAGFKLGMGSARARRLGGIGRAVSGRIFAPHVHQPGAVIPLPNDAPVTVEFEIAFRLGRDVTPDDPPGDVRDVIGETLVTFEIVRARYADRRSVGWPSFAADNAAFEALVAGPTIRLSEIERIRESAMVSASGREMARASTGEDGVDPFASLADLIAIAGERGMVLAKGSIISSGSVTKPFDVTPPCDIEAVFSGGRLSCRLEVSA